MEKETPLEHFARETAQDILKRHAPDCLDRPGLRDAIARLAHLGLMKSVQLYQLQQTSPETECGRDA
jgi:hypothetical protein